MSIVVRKNDHQDGGGASAGAHPRGLGILRVLLVTLALLSPRGSWATSAPIITLSPTVGPPTTTTRVTGTGFGSNEKVVIRFDSATVGAAHADAAGGFSRKITIPASALPGPHTIKVTGKASGLTAEATFTVRTDWPMFHFDPANTGLNPFENVLSPSTVSGLTQYWAAPTQGGVTASPVVGGGIVYSGGLGRAGSGKAHIYAWDAATGEVLWHQTTSGNVPSGMAVAGGRVFASTLLDHALHAYDAATGTPLWTAPGPTAPPTVMGGVIYVGENLNALYALDATTGERIWVSHQPGPIETGPAVVDGVVYVGSGDNNVYAFDASTGTMIWSTVTGGDISSSPTVVDGIVYAGSNDDSFYALDASTGAVLWSRRTGGNVSSSPAVAGEVVYVGSADFNVYAFDTATGKRVWTFPTGSYITLASPVVANGVVYIGSQDGRIYALDAETGEKLWSFLTGDIINSTPAVSDGTLYVGSFDDHVYSFRLQGTQDE